MVFLGVGSNEDGSVNAGKLANLIQRLHRKELLLPRQRRIAELNEEPVFRKQAPRSKHVLPQLCSLALVPLVAQEADC